MRLLLTLTSAIVASMLTSAGVKAQTAREVLDKTAAKVSNAEGISIDFSITSSPIGSTSGTIDVKGSKFQITTPQALVWFDGTTQWTYMKDNEEVNVSNPNDTYLQGINPNNIINLYKNGYTYELSSTEGKSYEVHMTATEEKLTLREVYLTVGKSDYIPTKVRMLQKGKWVELTISSLKNKTFADSHFQFNAKDYPEAEVIDLR